jgi:ribosomal protein L18
MLIKKEARQRRARKTRARIAEKKSVRLAINRTNLHIYAQGYREWRQQGCRRCGGQAYRREGKERGY